MKKEDLLSRTIFVIIPVFNAVDLLGECLESLLLQEGVKYKVIVVDDGSDDGTKRILMEKYSWVKVVTGNGTLWWAGSMNAGVNSILSSANDQDFILSFNIDLYVGRGYLKSLLNAYIKYYPCVVGSVSVWSSNKEKIAFCGVGWNKFTAKYTDHKDKLSLVSELNDGVIGTDLLPGRGTLFSVGLFKNIGGYDSKRLPQYLADEDFSLKAKKQDFKLVVSTSSVVYSYVENTGVNFNHDVPTFKLFFESLTSIKSANNVGYRLRFAKNNTPLPLLYFLFDISRVLGSFLIKWMRYNYGK